MAINKAASLIRNAMLFGGLAMLAIGLYILHGLGLSLTVTGAILTTLPIIGSLRK